MKIPAHIRRFKVVAFVLLLAGAGFAFLAYQYPLKTLSRPLFKTSSSQYNQQTVMTDPGEITNLTTSLKLLSVTYTVRELKVPGKSRRFSDTAAGLVRDYTLTFQNESNKPVSSVCLHFRKQGKLVGDQISEFFDPIKPQARSTKIIAGIEPDISITIQALVFRDHSFEGNEDTANDLIARLRGIKEEFESIHHTLVNLATLSDSAIIPAAADFLNDYNREKTSSLRGPDLGNTRFERDKAYLKLGKMSARGVVESLMRQLDTSIKNNRPSDVLNTIKALIKQSASVFDRL